MRESYFKIKGPPLTPTAEPLADNIMVDLNEKKRFLGLELILPPTVKKEIKAQLASPARRQSSRHP